MLSITRPADYTRILGVGQMSFVKHALFVGENAPEFTEHDALARYILNRFDLEELILSRGVVDALDNSSNKFGVGGKLRVDATGEVVDVAPKEIVDDTTLLALFRNISDVICQPYFGQIARHYHAAIPDCNILAS